MSIPFFFEPSYDFRMSYSFLAKDMDYKIEGISFENFLKKELRKFIEYKR
jgi:hypothetical protein